MNGPGDVWISTADAVCSSGLPARTLRKLARAGKVKFKRYRPIEKWYQAPRLRNLVRRYAKRQPDDPTPLGAYFGDESLSPAVAARFLGCSAQDVQYLLSIGRLDQYASGLLIPYQLVSLQRTLKRLARAGRLNFKIERRPGRNFLFLKTSLQRLIDAHTIARGQSTRVSRTLRSCKIATLKFPPGELMDKRDAAFLLSCSVRGVEYLMSIGRLRPIAISKRRVAFKRRNVLAVHRFRLRHGRKKMETRKNISLSKAVGIEPQKLAKLCG
jgi:hypothetical protein